MKTLVIGPKSYSSWSMRPWHNFKVNGIEFKEKTIPFEQVPGALELNSTTKDAIRKESPSGKIPLLIEGDRTLTECPAIIASQWQNETISNPKVIGALAIALELGSGFGAIRTKLSFCANDSVDEGVRMEQLPKDVQLDIDRISTIAISLGNLDHRGIVKSMLVPYLMRFVTYKINHPDREASKAFAAILDCEAVQEWKTLAAKEPRSLPFLHEYIRDFSKNLVG